MKCSKCPYKKFFKAAEKIVPRLSQNIHNAIEHTERITNAYRDSHIDKFMLFWLKLKGLFVIAAVLFIVIFKLL